jgi:hypothetical protein
MRKTVVKTGEETFPLIKKIRKSQLYLRRRGAAKWFFEDILDKKMDPKYIILGLTEENEKPISWVLIILPNKSSWFWLYKDRENSIIVWRYTKPTFRNQGLYHSLKRECISFKKRNRL